MASILKVDELQGITSAGDITVTSEGGAATQSLQQGLAKAWLNYIMDTPSVVGSFNIASVTDEGTGHFTQNFTNSMSAVDFLGCSSNNYPDSGSALNYSSGMRDSTTSTIGFKRENSGGAGSDLTVQGNGLAVFGDLA